MKGFFRYFKARLAVSLRAYPAVLVFALITCTCVCLLVSEVFTQHEGGEEKQEVTIGICGDLEDTYLDIGLYALENLDASQIYVKFVPMEIDEAEKKLERGDILGYGVIPAGFVDSVMSGDNMQIEYITKDSPSSMGPQLMNEVVKMVSDFVTQTQNCIYAYMDVAKANGVERAEYRPAADILNISYVQTIVSRGDIYKLETTGLGNGLDFKHYYTASAFIILFMLWGCACAPFLIKRDMSLERLLHARGRGSALQILCEYLPFFLMMALNALLMILSLDIMVPNGELFFEGVGGIGLFFDLIPAILLISAMQFFIFELCSGVISAVLLQMLTIVVLSFATGLFLPLYTLPKALQSAAPYTPTGCAFDYISNIINESYSSGVGKVLLYSVIVFLAASIAREIKIRRSRG